MTNATKRKLCMLLIILCLLTTMAVFVCYSAKRDPHITFSHAAGFYEKSFDLSIDCGDYAVYYTLDGSDPTVLSTPYSGPIRIEDASKNPNRYSARTDTVYKSGSKSVFPEKVSRDYTGPDHLVDKCCVVRAASFDGKGTKLADGEAVYFIGFDKKIGSGYDGIWIASVTTSPSNLFDEETGIYVIGSKGPNAVNYKNRGREWERPANVALFDADRNQILTQSCGIRIQGATTSAYLQKSLQCFARYEYSGSDVFSCDMFDNGVLPHRFVFFAGGQDGLFKLRDYMANTMERSLNFSTMDFIPCALFLNGEYWGFYYITEVYSEDYIYEHFGVAKSNAVMVKTSRVNPGTAEDAAAYRESLNYLEYANMADPASYAWACDIFDIDSFIDYYAAQIYIDRHADWPYGNEAKWWARDPGDSYYEDGRWRYMLFDVNSYSMLPERVSANTLQWARSKDMAFASLLENEDFKQRLATRLLYLGTDIYTPEKCGAFLDAYASLMAGPLAASCRRFYNSGMEDEFAQYMDGIRGFFNNRFAYVKAFIAEEMGPQYLEATQ